MSKKLDEIREKHRIAFKEHYQRQNDNDDPIEAYDILGKCMIEAYIAGRDETVDHTSEKIARMINFYTNDNGLALAMKQSILAAKTEPILQP